MTSDADSGPPDSPPDVRLDAIYPRLRKIAAAQMRRRDAAATLQPTALVHEAWIQLAGGDADAGRRFSSETQFAAVAAKVMRDVLVDQERARRAQKRGGDRARVTLRTELPEQDAFDLDLLALHEALEKLAIEDPEQARIVELRFFGGMTGAEIASAVGVSRRTVVRELKMAQAWLLREMERGDLDSDDEL